MQETHMGDVAETIRRKLSEAFSPSTLELVDDSDRHHGHAGHTGVGESHFNLRIEAQAFAGKARVMRQRMVMSVLADELAGPVHALSIIARAPGEA